MKKLGFITLITMFIVSINLYCFDLIEDTFDFIFDDLAKIIGIVVIIAAGVYFFKKYIKKDNSSNNKE
ncbi:hypothetical protein R4K54_13655 [Brachyspira murdochii]|uniref:Uncharacterized protein n=2 Tax=Brachyspira murdochii TaxID=84378 RepID=D5U9A9_BRAM5|nr:hypothetical protein [Brachyspira murdochii]ADG71282.1 conserved hypothetical protein [Brachyspira murdochii DSM 12563]PPS21168.1 hypothetical protein DJ52_12110 [Brachyspira murdochii]